MSRLEELSAPDLPGYRYIRALGTGGFSEVHLYEQQLPRRNVAVKVLLFDDLDAGAREQFVAEANAMARLSNHPYIVTIFHADVAADGSPYLVMEYCPGPSMSDRYRRRPFDVADVISTGIRVAGAVATSHLAGTLHRDIKPGNILINELGWPALTDFGISSALEEHVPGVTTSTLRMAARGATQSTPAGLSVPWSPPEMFLPDPRPDVRSDIYSLGATLYTLLQGRSPFERVGLPNRHPDLAERIAMGQVTPLTRSDVPAELLTVLAKAMQIKQASRYTTVVEFARALQQVEEDLGVGRTELVVRGQLPHLPRPQAVPATTSSPVARIESVVSSEPAIPDATQATAALRVDAPAPAEAHQQSQPNHDDLAQTDAHGTVRWPDSESDRTVLEHGTVSSVPHDTVLTAPAEPTVPEEPSGVTVHSDIQAATARAELEYRSLPATDDRTVDLQPRDASDQPPSQPAGPQRPRTARFAAILTVAAVALALGAVATATVPLWRVGPSAESAPQASSSISSYDPSSPTQSAAPSPGPSDLLLPATVVSPAEGPVTIRSDSSNLRCRLDSTTTLCMLRQMHVPPPAAACPTAGVAASVTLTGRTVSYPCLGDPIEADVVLARDTPFIYGDVTCILRAVSGMTCTTGDGYGFQIGIDSGISVVGD